MASSAATRRAHCCTPVIPNEEKWEVNAVLTPDTYKLLRKFELDSWSLSIREAGQINLLDYQAINCLWIQILVLDIAIQFLIHGHWGFEAMQDAKGDAMLANLKKAKASANGQDAGELVRLHNPLYCESWGKKEAAVVGGIVKAWRPPMLREGEGEMELVDDEDDEKKGETMDWKLLGLRLRDWDLAQGLIEEPNIVFGDDPASRSSVSKSDMCKRLAELLELRAIFVIAFLFLHPDSSEIYESQRKEEDIEMPMA
ncbi:hypothetical protein EJ06DRAFT_242163 [Trichodelitschia bisporula]|uniref:Uncharacterized protein n=1 Tax=Trichodelitschia bisporula TaxID=703511 RepID=A0A6G1HJP2_9PEZI|nr:hypothetical protein EJ06DRAFT_242163 [Trichodelitschia bisporula]